MTDIEKELKHYREYFKGKVIFCNCDDPQESNFWKYFSLNFERLKLKKLISTHYVTSGQSYYFEMRKIGEPSLPIPLDENGDFRSPECIEILKEADIVITNPPFSLFREYIAQLFEYNKSFIIIGNLNAITYKESFLLIKNNKMWVGYNNGPKEYIVPNHYEIKESGYREEGGIKYRMIGNTYWFTNIEIKKRYEDLILYKKYNSLEYPKYDNYDIINVDKTKDIPVDYDGVMGVPITFMDKYNPNQFEILGLANSARWINHECLTLLNKRKLYNRVLIKKRVK